MNKRDANLDNPEPLIRLPAFILKQRAEITALHARIEKLERAPSPVGAALELKLQQCEQFLLERVFTMSISSKDIEAAFKGIRAALEPLVRT